MGSRRETARSSFGNGRSSNGNDVSGRSRSSGCSYLSNVRPENRSTLCCVMAQLAEEMQPSFVTTLKSKAVSETCNVKFTCVVTGHPVPQVTWYKDDKQLDRYCGLPKYEIFHNGQNHSLHIYNCTVDDAAIYQASAINTKGIVSCSGVLEVGEMNEFKIHQRYFAKLKQKVENKCRETEEKENLEPLRTISPDRTQRKRRSTMGAFVSTPSPKEDEGNEAEGLETECRLQKGTVEEVYNTPASDTNKAVSAKTIGQINNDPDNKSKTYIYDPDHNTFTSHQPKSPFVMKKIKISDSVTHPKQDMFGERKIMKDSISSAALVCTETVQTNVNSEEVMEVEDIVDSSLTNANSKNMEEEGEHGKIAKEEAVFIKRLSKDGNMFNKRLESSQRENVTPSESSVAASCSPTLSEKGGKKIPKHKNEGICKDTEKCLENQVPYIIPAQNKSSNKSRLPSTIKGSNDKTEHVRTLDTKEKSNTSLDGSGFSKRVVSPQTESLLYDKETSPCQKKESASQPAVPSEVTEAHADMTRNGAPVGLKPPVDQHNIFSEPPQKIDAILTSPLSSVHQPSPEKIPLGDSRKSNGSCTAIFTHLQKSAHEIPCCSESILECNVSSVTEQSQVDTAIKTFEGTEIQEDEKLEVGDISKLVVQAVNGTPGEKILEMETEPTGLHVQSNGEKTKVVGKEDSEAKPVQSLIVESRESQSTLKVVENTSLDCEDLRSVPLDTAPKEQTLENTNALKDVITFTKIPKPESKVISIAELLRSQIKALELTQNNPVSIMSNPSKLTQDPVRTAKAVCQGARDESKKSKSEVNTFKTKNETEASNDRAPHTNLKETLMKVYQQLNEKEQEQISNEVSTTFHKPVCVPSISLKDTEKAADTTERCERVGKSNEDVMDTGQEAVVPLKDSSVVPRSKSKNVKDRPPSLPSEERFIKEIPSIPNPPKTSLQDFDSLIKPPLTENETQEEQGIVMEHTKDETLQCPNMVMAVKQINHNNKLETGIKVSEQCKIEEHIANSSQRLKTYNQSDCEFSTSTQVKDINLTEQETSVVKEDLRSNPFNILTPEFSPLSKKIDLISPIPSATPQELASGARRKIPTSNTKTAEAQESTSPTNSQTQKREMPVHSNKLSASTVSPSLSRRSALLQPAEEQTSVAERQSPLLTRRKMASETQTQSHLLPEKIPAEGKPMEKDKHNPFKAPQVIRKIRGEAFADGSGHLKLWCQFFNVLSDSNIKWYKNEEEIAQVKKNAGDETQVNLAIVQASCKDSGVYGCSLTNEYGSDSTDFLLSADILAGMVLREDLGVGEEIEMTPLIFSKGLADSGIWGNKFFGRIMMTESRIGDGCSHKVWRAKVIYGLEPVFESGNTCVIKVCSPIFYGGKEESCLIERNLHLMKQECRIQNLAREYCKIFSAEARVIENFGSPLEVIPVYLMYRPANPVPYATVETDLTGVYKKYSVLDNTGRIDMKTGSEVEQKCCALQHWIFQWTTGNMLLTRLEGVDTKLTNVGVSVKTTGHLGLSVEGNPKVFDQFVSQHKCNYFCGLLGLRSLKVMDSLSMPTKPKGSKSPLLQRKKAVSSSSPQTSRKAAVSPRMPRKAEHEDNKTKHNDSEAHKVVET